MKQQLVVASVSILLALMLSSCSDDTPATSQQSTTADVESIATQPVDNTEPLPAQEATPRPATTRDVSEFQQLYKLIVYGQANFNQVYAALKTDDVGELVNIIHALYSMRWLRGVNNILKAMWEMDQKAYPELNWDKIKLTPVRIAIASTINRIKILDTREYKDFIRQHKYDDHEFHRAQVVVALGLNQDPVDIAYLHEMAEGDNIYVSQSAITSLALMNNEQAKESLIKLANKYKDSPRGRLVMDVLKNAYDMVPTQKPAETAG